MSGEACVNMVANGDALLNNLVRIEVQTDQGGTRIVMPHDGVQLDAAQAPIVAQRPVDARATRVVGARSIILSCRACGSLSRAPRHALSC